MKHFKKLPRRAALFAVLIASTCVGLASSAAETTRLSPPLAEGYSAAALFNQGNAFALHGETGEAILHYEQALLLAPGDTDIAANLHAVRLKAGLPEVKENPVLRTLASLPPSTMAWLGSGGLLLIGLGLLLSRFRSPRRRTFRWLAWAGALLVAGAVGNACALWPTLHEAVVLAKAAPARTAPVATGDTVFTLHEGETVSIRSERKDFILVHTPAGRAGWVTRGAIARVVPVTSESAPIVRPT